MHCFIYFVLNFYILFKVHVNYAHPIYYINFAVPSNKIKEQFSFYFLMDFGQCMVPVPTQHLEESGELRLVGDSGYGYRY
mgnify:CR=1 FL=1